jgi:hypothetical protein
VKFLPPLSTARSRRSRIVVRGAFSLDPAAPIKAMFYPLIRFLQEALPFARLIGPHLTAKAA